MQWYGSKKEGKNRFLNESKNTFIECIPDSEAFWLPEMLFAIKNREDIENLENLASLENK